MFYVTNICFSFVASCLLQRCCCCNIQSSYFSYSVFVLKPTWRGRLFVCSPNVFHSMFFKLICSLTASAQTHSNTINWTCFKMDKIRIKLSCILILFCAFAAWFLTFLTARFKRHTCHLLTLQKFSIKTTSTSRLMSDYPAGLYPVCAALEEVRGHSDHLTQAAAVDTRVLRGAFEMKI